MQQAYCDGAKIIYDNNLNYYFRNPNKLIDFCKKLNIIACWENTLEEVTTASWFDYSCNKDNILLINKSDHNLLKKKCNINNDKIIVDNDIKSNFNFFDFINTEDLSGNVIAFKNIQEANDLFSKLKAHLSSWASLEFNGRYYLIDKKNNFFEVLDKLSNKDCIDGKTAYFEEKSLDFLEIQRPGVVVLSMNQSNSYTQYSHEILTFLLEGVDVLVYDNAGKGLSKGCLNQQELTEAVETCGNFLMNKLGYPEDKIIFKGQCAGGLPTSEVARSFTKAHFWIDQAPNNFTDLVGEASNGILQTKAENKNNAFLSKGLYSILGISSALFFSPVASTVSSLALPSYNVMENLKANQGIQIYTIGIPDDRGYGGDQLVPISHSLKIKEMLEKRENGFYLPMKGAVHVTDWWIDPIVINVIKTVFSKLRLSIDVFKRFEDKKP